MHVHGPGRDRLDHWDDVIEEASGELESIERQLQVASEQLLDLQARKAQHTEEEQTSAAAKDKVSATVSIH